MAKVRARPETGTLYLDFSYRGVRCREQTTLPDTAENRRKVQALCGLIRVDGKAMRFAGVQPDGIPAMRQTGLTVTPTRSIFQFEDGGVALTVEFCSPLSKSRKVRPGILIRLATSSTVRPFSVLNSCNASPNS